GVARLAHHRRLPGRVRAVAVVAGRPRPRRGPGRPERARPRRVPDPVARRPPPAALHRGARGEAGEEPGAPRPAPARGRSRRGARAPARPGGGGRRRPSPARRHGVGGARGPRGERVLPPPQHQGGRRDPCVRGSGL
ncbi:MAG: hypothetical protein AVDCRST_MAG35-3202, partial [uncultured Quadrisphaera sp.]